MKAKKEKKVVVKEVKVRAARKSAFDKGYEMGAKAVLKKLRELIKSLK